MNCHANKCIECTVDQCADCKAFRKKGVFPHRLRRLLAAAVRGAHTYSPPGAFLQFLQHKFKDCSGSGHIYFISARYDMSR